MIALGKSKTKRDLPGHRMEAFDLYSPEIDANPFPYYEILREQYPCYWSESGKLWILSRYDDIVQATRDWETFSSSQGNMIDELPGPARSSAYARDERSSSSTIFPAKSRSACSFAPWACRSAIMPRSGARSFSRS